MQRLQILMLATLATLYVCSATPLHHDKRGSTLSGRGAITWYNPGMGSCGEKHGDDDLVVAVNTEQMNNGENPNKNPNCGKSITVKGKGGKSVTVKVVDTCPGCSEGDLDLSPAAFAKIADLGKGRLLNIAWSST